MHREGRIHHWRTRSRRREETHDVENVCRAGPGNHAARPLRLRPAESFQSHQSLPSNTPVRREARRVCASSARNGRHRGALLIPIVEPECAQDLARELAAANAKGQAVIPRGGGTKTDWGNPPTRADVTLSTKRLNRIVEHAWADLTVTVEAGCTVADLQTKLAEHNQRLAVDVLWPERATIGGILSTNDSGAMRLRYGSLRDLIIGITLALPDGTIAESGGKVVKNVAGYDLPKLATGALGTLGVITRAVFRLHPMFPHTLSLSFDVPTVEELQKKVSAIQD